MNLEESNEFLKNEDNKNKKKAVLLVLIIACIVFIVILMILIGVLKIKDSTTKKLNVDNGKRRLSSSFFYNKDNVDYVSVEQLAAYIGYKYNKGEYRKYTEDADYCYIQSDYEVVAFHSDSNIVKKFLLNKDDGQIEENDANKDQNVVNQTTNQTTNETITYTVKSSNNSMELYELENNIIQVEDKMYVPLNNINNLFNINFIIDNNVYNIYTLNFLVKSANSYIKKINIPEISYDYENVRALVDNMIIAKDSKGNYGVISRVDGKEILGFKYENIQYIQNKKEFFVYAEGTVGVLDSEGKTIISPKKYESLNVFDESNNLYLAKNSKAEYGILNRDGKEIVPTSFDEIGLSKFEDFELEDSETPNLLNSKYIVVCENKKFGLYDIDGNKLINSRYDGFGYLKDSEDDKENQESVLIIPEDYKIYGIVVEKNGLYGIFDFNTGSLTIPTVFSKIYSKNESGEIKYYLQFNDDVFDLEEYLEEYGLVSSGNNKKTNKKDKNSDDEEEIDEEVKEEIDDEIDEELDEEEFEDEDDSEDDFDESDEEIDEEEDE